jgi:hypothetical protein
MSSYKVKTGVIEVRFMKSGDAGFNVARILKELIAAERESYKEFSILPLSKEGNNICRAAYVPNKKDGIGNYYRHMIKFNNINGSMDIDGYWKTKTGRFSVSDVSPVKECLH